MGPLGTFARVFHVVVLAAWFGGCLCFALLVAPNVFQVVPSRDIAGDLITRVLHGIDLFGLVATPVLVLTLIAGWLPLGNPLRVRFLATLAMGAATAASRFWLTPEMLRIRHAMKGPIETLGPADPDRLEFTRLHDYSTTLVAIHTILALILLVHSVSETSPRRKGGIEL